jgi:protein involved in polysaccharide export with SLBB domain
LDFKPDMQIVDAIALAGGPTDKGNLSHVSVVRSDGTKAKVINVDFAKVLAGRDPKQNIALQNGDIVYVNPKGFTIESIVNFFYLLRTAAGF